MANKPDDNVYDILAAHGFYYKTDPKRPGAAEDDSAEAQTEAVKKKNESSLYDKRISTAFDVPVSFTAKAGELTGRAFQATSDVIASGLSYLDTIPGINRIDDGLKALDKSGFLNALSKGQLPGGEAFSNFTSDAINRITAVNASKWIGQILALPSLVGFTSTKKLMPESWRKIVDEITLKLTRDLLTEIGQILVDWYQDPKTLCCLIKNLAALGSMIQGYGTWDQEKDKFAGSVKVEDIFGPTYTKTLDLLHKIKDFLDIIIVLLGGFFPAKFDDLDIGKILSDLLIGMLMAIMEAMIATGKKEWYDKLNEWFKDLNQLDQQCLPLQKLIDMLYRFMADDHGLFNLIRRYMDDYARTLKWKFLKNFKEQYVSMTRDRDALIFLRKLIQKIIDALENLEMCLESDYHIYDNENPLSNMNTNDDLCPYGISAGATNNWESCMYRTFNNNNIMCRVSDRVPNNNGRTSYCNHPDAIANYFNPQNLGPGNIGKVGKTLPNKRIGDKNQVAVIFPTDNEVKNFLINRMGYSSDRAGQVIAQSKVATGEGKVEGGLGFLSSLGIGNSKNTDGSINQDFVDKRQQLMSALGDCAKTLNPKTIADLANKLKDIL